jgi:hypothetical protein
MGRHRNDPPLLDVSFHHPGEQLLACRIERGGWLIEEPDRALRRKQTRKP